MDYQVFAIKFSMINNQNKINMELIQLTQWKKTIRVSCLHFKWKVNVLKISVFVLWGIKHQ